MGTDLVSLFTGAGGLDLGLERAGYKVAAQVELDAQCRGLLKRHWPSVPKFADVRYALSRLTPYRACHVVCGGDPCPSRSTAKGNRESKHPDLSGYYLAVVAGLRPQWVVRENVLAPDVADFECALDLLGYHCVIVQADAAPFTNQSRRREFVVGSQSSTWPGWACRQHDLARSDAGFAKGRKAPAAAACLTARLGHRGYDQTYVFDGKQLRIHSSDERAALAGFPEDWFCGLSETAVARMCGNAVVVGVAQFLGRIMRRFDRVQDISVDRYAV